MTIQSSNLIMPGTGLCNPVSDPEQTDSRQLALSEGLKILERDSGFSDTNSKLMQLWEKSSIWNKAPNGSSIWTKSSFWENESAQN